MPRYLLDARTATAHFPGIGRYVSNLARAMVPLLQTDESLWLLVDSRSTPYWPLPAANQYQTAVSPFSLAQQWHIPRLIQHLQADVYHSPYYLMPYRPGIPTLVTLYDLIPQHFPNTVSVQARLLFQLTTRLAIHAATHLIAISEATRQDVIQAYKVATEKITAVPLAPDPRFRPQPTPILAAIRHKYNLPEKFVLYLGINKPHKNLSRLLTAWQQLENQFPDVELIIAGKWDNRYPQTKKQAQQLRHVRFLGSVTDEELPALYSAATVFVFPSLYEGFGLPVVEAMACGTAVACSHTASLPEIGGDTVLYFNPWQTEEIATQIGRLLQDTTLRLSLAEQGKKRAQTFTWQKTATITLALYRQLAADTSP